MLVTLVPAGRPLAHGEAWRVIDKRAVVRFSPLVGPWLLLVREGRPPDDLDARWVHALMDPVFKVMPGPPG